MADPNPTASQIVKGIMDAGDPVAFVVALWAAYKYHKELAGGLTAASQVARLALTYIARMIDHNVLVRIRNFSKKWPYINAGVGVAFASGLVYLYLVDMFDFAHLTFGLLATVAIVLAVDILHWWSLLHTKDVKAIDFDRVRRSAAYEMSDALMEYEEAKEEYDEALTDFQAALQVHLATPGATPATFGRNPPVLTVRKPKEPKDFLPSADIEKEYGPNGRFTLGVGIMYFLSPALTGAGLFLLSFVVKGWCDPKLPGHAWAHALSMFSVGIIGLILGFINYWLIGTRIGWPILRELGQIPSDVILQGGLRPLVILLPMITKENDAQRAPILRLPLREINPQIKYGHVRIVGGVAYLLAWGLILQQWLLSQILGGLMLGFGLLTDYFMQTVHRRAVESQLKTAEELEPANVQRLVDQKMTPGRVATGVTLVTVLLMMAGWNIYVFLYEASNGSTVAFGEARGLLYALIYAIGSVELLQAAIILAIVIALGAFTFKFVKEGGFQGVVRSVVLGWVYAVILVLAVGGVAQAAGIQAPAPAHPVTAMGKDATSPAHNLTDMQNAQNQASAPAVSQPPPAPPVPPAPVVRAVTPPPPPPAVPATPAPTQDADDHRSARNTSSDDSEQPACSSYTREYLRDTLHPLGRRLDCP